ncbi:MAG: hypothetical protein QXH26_03065 [Candidatus Hadarchaeales archaeon]
MSFEWLFPLVLPFVFGLLIGLFVKQAIKLVTLAIAIVALLALTGAATFTLPDLWKRASEFLPTLSAWSQSVIGTLPYSVATFALGLVVGIWKG